MMSFFISNYTVIHNFLQSDKENRTVYVWIQSDHHHHANKTLILLIRTHLQKLAGAGWDCRFTLWSLQSEVFSVHQLHPLKRHSVITDTSVKTNRLSEVWVDSRQQFDHLEVWVLKKHSAAWLVNNMRVIVEGLDSKHRPEFISRCHSEQTRMSWLPRGLKCAQK